MRDQTAWAEEELAQARQLRRDGKGKTAIGKALRRSPNSVIGALWRAGEPGFRVNHIPNLRRPSRLPASSPRGFSWENQDDQT